MSPFIRHFAPPQARPAFEAARAAIHPRLEGAGTAAARAAIAKVPALHSTDCDFAGPIVRLGRADELDAEAHAALRQALQELIPWRKGPFELCGINIDAEWRSDHKWDLIAPHLPPLKDAVICDIGANSGYYMYRMLAQQPALVLGLDPTPKYALQFELLQKLAAPNCLHYEPCGFAELAHCPDYFDVIFCMGIIYHHPDPIGLLRLCRQALKKGGTLILESQTIPGLEPIALYPQDTYALVKNTHFVPTSTCLRHWMLSAGFVDPTLIASHPMNSSLQRQTPWMPFRSYSDFVDEAAALTREGYPAPHRACLRGTR